MQRDYDKAEQECQRYKTLYDVTKEEVCNFEIFWVNSWVFSLFFAQRGFSCAYVYNYSSASVCFCIVSTSVCAWLQHFQEKMKLSEQLRMAESERKTQEDKVLYTEQHT